MPNVARGLRRVKTETDKEKVINLARASQNKH